MTKLWKPRMGGKYWTYAVGSWGRWYPDSRIWMGGIDGLVFKKLGMIFKTKEEAEDALPKFYEMITGKAYVEDFEHKS